MKTTKQSSPENAPQRRYSPADAPPANSTDEDRLISFANSLPGYTWMKDLTGRYVYGNAALQTLPAYRGGYLGMTDADLWPAEIAEVYRANDLKVIAERQPLEAIEPYRVNGQDHLMRVSKFPIFDNSGAVIMVGGSSVDITAQAETEARFREYEHAIAGAVEMIAIIDSDYRYLMVNEAYLNQRGVLRQDVIGRTLWEVLPEDLVRDTVKPKIDEALSGSVVKYETQVAHMQAGTRHLLASYFPIDLPQGRRVVCILEDITERKQAEAALRTAEQHYRDIFENAGEGIFQTTQDGRYIAANPALAHMHGFDSPEQLMSERKSSDAYVDPARREAFKRLLETKGVVRAFEFDLVRRDGSKISVSVDAHAVCDKDGATRYYEGTVQDITERKASQEALRKSEERYRDLVENSHELICTHDLQGLILSANNAAAVALGYNLDLFVGKKNIRDILAPEVRDQFDEYMERLRREGSSGGLMLVQTSSGERRVWEYYNSLRTEGVDTPIVRGMARDVTEQRRAETALRESEERYRELFENSRDAIYVHDLRGIYTSVNRAAEKLSGFTRDEIIGRHYSNFVSPRHLKDARENFCRKLDVPIETTYETEALCKNGDHTPVEVSSRLIYKDGAVVGIQGTVRDISERKRSQQALQTYARRVIEAQEAERQNVARELHDQIGQILTAVLLNLHSIQRSCDTEACLPNIDESVEVVEDALRRVRELSLELRPTLLDDLGLIAALRWYAVRYTARTGILTEITGDTEVGRISHEVETACFRIIQEALTNTARHSRATRVAIHISRTNVNLYLTVRDNGIGFDADDLLKRKSPSMAIGLHGMRERAAAVHGVVQITSAPGNGTHVRVNVPLLK